MNQKKGEDGNMMFFVLIAMLIATMALYPYLKYYFIVSWKFISMGLFYGLSWIPTPILNCIFPWAYFSGVHDLQGSSTGAFNMLYENSARFFYNNDKALEKIAKFFKLLVMPYIILWVVVCCWKIMTKKNFLRVYGLGKAKAIDELIEQESSLWPGIKVIINAHPELVKDPDEGEWAMSRRPEKFVREEELVKDDIDDMEVKYFTLLEEKTFRKMVDQLGPKFNGFDNLSRPERQILAIVLPKLCRDKAIAEKMIAELSEYYSSRKKGFLERFKYKSVTKKLDKKIDGIISKYEKNPAVQDCVNKHFYVKTLFATLLEKARLDGVLSNGEFLWLKLQKRDLWYMLCSAGRKVPFIECAGPWSHWLSECALDKKISNPMVMNAVRGIDQYLIDHYEEYRSAFAKEDDDNY